MDKQKYNLACICHIQKLSIRLSCVPNTEQVTSVGNSTAVNQLYRGIGHGESSPTDSIQQTVQGSNFPINFSLAGLTSA